MSWPAFAAGFGVATALYLFPACGGGSGSGDGPQQQPVSVPPVADSADHYMPQLFGRQTHGVITTLANEFYTEWFCDAAGTCRWGDGTEPIAVKNCNGKNYMFQTGFGSASTGALYPVDQVKALFTDVSGATVDLYQLCPALQGTVAIPMDVPASGQQRLKVHFLIWDSPARLNHRFGYWEVLLTYGQTANNPCWTGSGEKTRPVIRWEEGWWDDTGGWARAHPRIANELPWVNGTPKDVDIITEQYTMLGRDAGTLWRGNNGGTELCLRSN